jgi:hypothetical protein
MHVCIFVRVDSYRAIRSLLCVIVVMNVTIFVRCIAVRCVSAAIVGGGDKPPCETGQVRNRAVIIAWKCHYSTLSKIVGYVFVKVKVMLSVSQVSSNSSVFQFCVVALRLFIFIVVSGGQSLRGKSRRHRLSLVSVSSWCAHRNSFFVSLR